MNSIIFLKENIYIHTHTYFVIALSTKTPKKCRCIIFSETISTMFAYKHLLINREEKKSVYRSNAFDIITKNIFDVARVITQIAPLSEHTFVPINLSEF